ncbi:MAG: aminomethyl-transferring glycine dehydrogenase subunit GcvPA [Planctomycetota bacterium]|nr:aminomethyl-transferring glycine dehydrogenase subunit GcvPA [Planctomycetota bacterium]
MDYTQLTKSDEQAMLATIGVRTVDELFAGVAEAHKLKERLNIPPGLAEMELLADLERLASKNVSTDQQISFLGGGIYDHFVPTIVGALAMQSEFLTAYTPYQAEASQGVLQAFYEFQTMVCQLTAMDIANSSLYEFASAAAEAALMACQITRRSRIVVSDATHPDLRRVLKTYLYETDHEVIVVKSTDGVTPIEVIRKAVDDQTAAVIVQHPTFFGTLEDMPAIADLAHDGGALLIASVDPISCGLLKRPGDYGADIVIAEGQSLGVPQSYGGPVLGLLACRQDYLRKIPGRLVGQTTDRDGRVGYCLTLQTREQHIRREKATSNICTNQGLLAMHATVYMAALGKSGIAQVAKRCFDNAHYAAERIAALSNFELAFDVPFFKEFVVRSKRKDVTAVLKACQQAGVLGGVPLGKWYPQLDDCFMVAVTEKRTKEDMDRLVGALRTA